MPKRGFLLFTLLFFLCRHHQSGQPRGTGHASRLPGQIQQPGRAPGATEASGYWNMICAAFNVLRLQRYIRRRAGHGAGLARLDLLGTVLGTVALGAVWCGLPVCWYPVSIWFRCWKACATVTAGRHEGSISGSSVLSANIRSSWRTSSSRNREDDRRMISPAFRRRGGRDARCTGSAGLSALWQHAHAAAAHAPGGMPIYPYGMPPRTLSCPVPQPQGEIYDELIVPEGRQLPLAQGRGKGQKGEKKKNNTRPG